MTGDFICCLSVLGEPIIGRGSGRRAAALCRILKRRKNSFENTKTGKTREKFKIKIANSLIINVIGNLFWVPGRTRTVDIQNHKQRFEFFGIPFIHRGFLQSRKSHLR